MTPFLSVMTTDELVAAIEAITLPSGRSFDLRMKDRPTLERLVYLARAHAQSGILIDFGGLV